ncbi:MAG: tetratricopeptide repeat protein [Verrucomicrobia bacterium]|nr:tetratricopeptide repeat protein [Verrucomicrobiota bacterium]
MNIQPHCPHLSARQVALTLTAGLGLCTGLPAAAPPPLDPLRAEMRAEHYDPAIAMADKLIAAQDPQADEAQYLKALALFHTKKFAAAVTAAEQLPSAFPQSVWRFKATFLKAQALVEQKQFQPAAAIYQSEATRLLAAGRKQELVGVIVAFADKLTVKPDPAVPDAPKPDFQKAHKLYTKALTMEISREFRDELVFKKARAIQQAGNFPQAVLDFQAYLTDFDPAWTGPAGSGTARLPLQNPPPAGQRVAWARYRLAEAQIQANNIVGGRMELEDLLKMIMAPNLTLTALIAELGTEDGKKLPAEIRWLMVQSYFTQPAETGMRNMPNSVGQWVQAPNNGAAGNNNFGQTIGNTGGLPTTDIVLFVLREGELDQAIKTCREFLTAFPEGSRAVRAAWMIAEAYQNAGRADDAIKAFRDFIAGQGFRLPEGEAAQKMDEELRAAPATHLANLKMRALFRIGSILGQQKKREEAIATWQGYVKEYPNGPQWSESQNAIIDAEFQMGMDALAERNEPLALQRFEEFLRAHPLDERSPRILYLFGAVHEAKARALEEAKGEQADISASYRKAIEEWTKLVSKYPQSPEARLALMKSGGIHEEKFGEFDKALHLYRKLVGEFSYAEANGSITRLTQKSLELAADRTFRTNEQAVVKLKLRNLEKCTFRLHKIDLQAYFRKMHGITGVEGLDVSLIQPDKTWDFKPDGYAKYKPFEQEIKIPFPDNAPGAYVVTAGDDEWESTVLVLRSDLEVIVKSSRREVLAFVQNMLTGQPATDVDLLVSDGKAVAATGKTGPDGVFKTTLESLKDLADVRLFALGKGHAASFNLELAGLRLSSGLTAKGYLYTDRPAYLPGETVAMRGILREVRDTAYAVPANSEFKVSITDPQGRLLSEQSVKVSRFGTFDSTLVLPATTANGQYVIAAHQDRKGLEPLHFQGAFEVRSFKLEKIKLAMEFPRRVWFRGETIEATLQAAFYWGEPLAERPLRCTLPDGRSQTVTTDAEGKAKLTFDTTGLRPGSAVTFTATLDGENVTTTETVTLARLGFGIAAKPSQPVVIAGEPFDLTLTTTGADGKPTGEALKVVVLRVEQPKTSPVMALLPWLGGFVTPAAEVKDSESEIKTDPATGKATVALKLEKGGSYRLRTTGTDRFGQTITSQCQVEVSDASDAVKLRLFADTATLKVGQDSTVRLHSRLAKGLALVTFEGETILRHRIIELKKDDNEIPVKVSHDLFPNFRLAVAAMDGRELRGATKNFTVERELKVTVKPLKDAFLPGEAGQVELTVTDQTGQPVAAELSLALVNEALFAVCPDTLTPILDFFQKDAHRHAEFKVGATCAFRYQGTTRPVSKDVSAEAGRLTRSEAERATLEKLRKDMAANKPVPVILPAVQPVSAAALSNGTLRLTGGVGGGGGAVGDERDGDAFAADQSGQLALPDAPVREKADRNGRAGEAKPGDKAAAPPRREVRGEGRWLPSIITGADGKAVATVPLPETTTAWRLTARGCTVETLVGQATAQTLTRKDFFVELKTPAFLREGDELRVVGRIHNLTDFAGPVLMKLRVLDAKDKAKVLAEREKTIEVKAKAGAEVAFDAVTVPAALEIITELTGTANLPGGTEGATGNPQRDALALSIPVKPWGLQYAAHAGGSANADTAAVLGLPGGRPYSSLWMSVAIGPDVRTAVLDMALRRSWAGPCNDMARLLPPAWGDTPANDLLAAATALRYANTGKVDETYTRQLAARARALVAALVAGQAADGTWACQSLGHLTTARVFWALIEARQSGIVVHKDAIEKAAAALLKQFEACDANDNDSKAVILHALSTDKRADFANCNRLYRERNALGNSSLAHLARAFFNLERREIATELATLLESRVKPDADKPVGWEGGCKTIWLNDTDETTAMVLLAMAETLPVSKATTAAAQSLLRAHGCFGFPYPRAHGPAVAALAIWFAQGLQQATDLEIAVVVNGKEIGMVKTVATLGQHLLPVPADLVKAEKNLVEFKMKGRGRYTYAATLFGFSPDVKATPPNVVPCMENVQHLHAQLEYRGKPIGAGSSSPVKELENGQRLHVVVSTNRGWNQDGRRYVLEIALPPGTRLDESTLTANSSQVTGREITDSTITLFFNHWLQQVNFEVTGYVPGKFRMLPPVIRELGNPAFMSIGPVAELTVLATGEKSPDPYQMNDGEHYALGKCYFDDGDLATALEHLAVVLKNNPKYNESELARMLLWIYTSPKFYDARKIVELFEVLRERYPQLEIPYDKILVVGKAYTDIGEFERSWLVFRAAIAASFNNDSAISAVLEDEGRFLGSIDFQERIWREYPDTADVLASYFALSQLLYQKAPKAHELPKEDNVQPEKIAMLKRTADLLFSFLAMYPKDPLADDAGFSLANCLLTLKNYPLVVSLGNEFAKKYPDSPMAPGFQYMSALGLFWQNQYAEALAAAKVVADGDSKDRDFARYILGQIYHAESKPKDAIEWYDKVRQLYPDAAEAIAYFEKKSIGLDEITVVKPGQAVELTLKYRNIKEASLQIYRVDLMKLYLQQKNLSAITSVQLAGIAPELEQTTVLGDGKDYVEKERKVALKLKDEAAYLVICRGDDLFTSGMVLITPLKIEVQEDAASGRVRANVLDTAKGGYRPEVHVKAIGSADTEFRSGETDLRGLFVADTVHGKATVIAREGESRYAFFRGETWLGAPANAPAAPPKQPAAEQQQLDYQNNLNDQNDAIQRFNNGKFNEQRRQAPNKGVQMKQAF